MPTDLKRETLLPIIRQRVEPDSLVITDGLNVYDTLDAEGFRHERVSHSETLVQYGPNGRAAHINGIENFWAQAKRHLRKYNGVPTGHFELFLKECEWRFNYGSPRELLKTLRRWHRAGVVVRSPSSDPDTRSPMDDQVTTTYCLIDARAHPPRRLRCRSPHRRRRRRARARFLSEYGYMRRRLTRGQFNRRLHAAAPLAERLFAARPDLEDDRLRARLRCRFDAGRVLRQRTHPARSSTPSRHRWRLPCRVASSAISTASSSTRSLPLPRRITPGSASDTGDFEICRRRRSSTATSELRARSRRRGRGDAGQEELDAASRQSTSCRCFAKRSRRRSARSRS